MTDYMDKYMAFRRREWAVRRECGILTQLHWILSETCAAFEFEIRKRAVGTSRVALTERQSRDRGATALVWRSKQWFVKLVGPAEPRQGNRRCEVGRAKPEKSERTKAEAPLQLAVS